MTADVFASRLTGECGVAPGAHVLAAVSGGADSMALLALLGEMRARLGLRLSCVHVEHGLRGEESLADMALVQTRCAQMDVPFYAERVDVSGYARAHGCGVENAARTLRYDVFARTAKRIGADAVALAHHAQDQAETLLMHAARGCDVRGLGAMRWRRGLFIRPLLQAQPQALRAYLTERGLSWREDATNGDVAFARNRIRHEAIPALEAAYPGAVQALWRLAQAAQRDEDYLSREAARLGEGRMLRLAQGLALRTNGLREAHEALLGRLLVMALQRAGVQSPDTQGLGALLDALTRGEDAAVNLPQGARAILVCEALYLLRADGDVPATALACEGETNTPFGVFSVREALPGEYGDGRLSQSLDEHLLRGALVTQRRAGDALVPFGRKTPVKLKKLAIDAGLARPLRDNLPVLRGDAGILWAVGLRPSALCAREDGGRRLLLSFSGEAAQLLPGLDI